MTAWAQYSFFCYMFFFSFIKEEFALTEWILNANRPITLERLSDAVLILGTHAELDHRSFVQVDDVVRGGAHERGDLCPRCATFHLLLDHVVSNAAASVVLWGFPWQPAEVCSDVSGLQRALGGRRFVWGTEINNALLGSEIKVDYIFRVTHPVAAEPCGPCGPVANPLFLLYGHGPHTFGITTFFFACHHRGRSCRRTTPYP